MSFFAPKYNPRSLRIWFALRHKWHQIIRILFLRGWRELVMTGRHLLIRDFLKPINAWCQCGILGVSGSFVHRADPQTTRFNKVQPLPRVSFWTYKHKSLKDPLEACSGVYLNSEIELIRDKITMGNLARPKMNRSSMVRTGSKLTWNTCRERTIPTHRKRSLTPSSSSTLNCSFPSIGNVERLSVLWTNKDKPPTN